MWRGINYRWAALLLVAIFVSIGSNSTASSQIVPDIDGPHLSSPVVRRSDHIGQDSATVRHARETIKNLLGEWFSMTGIDGKRLNREHDRRVDASEGTQLKIFERDDPDHPVFVFDVGEMIPEKIHFQLGHDENHHQPYIDTNKTGNNANIKLPFGWTEDEAAPVVDALKEWAKELRSGGSNDDTYHTVKPPPSTARAEKPEVGLKYTGPKDIVFPGKPDPDAARRLYEQVRLEDEHRRLDFASRIYALTDKPGALDNSDSGAGITSGNQFLWMTSLYEKLRESARPINVLDRVLGSAYDDMNPSPLARGFDEIYKGLFQNAENVPRGGLLRTTLQNGLEGKLLDVLHDRYIEATAKKSGDPVDDLFANTWSAARPDNLGFGIYSYLHKVEDRFDEDMSKAMGMMWGPDK